MGATSGDGATGEANSPGVWDLICALTVVDLVCYLLHKHEVSSNILVFILVLVLYFMCGQHCSVGFDYEYISSVEVRA